MKRVHVLLLAGAFSIAAMAGCGQPDDETPAVDSLAVDSLGLDTLGLDSTGMPADTVIHIDTIVQAPDTVRDTVRKVVHDTIKVKTDTSKSGTANTRRNTKPDTTVTAGQRRNPGTAGGSTAGGRR